MWLSNAFTESIAAGAVAGFVRCAVFSPHPVAWCKLTPCSNQPQVCDFTLYPIDTIKTRMQAPGGLRSTGGLAGTCVACIVPRLWQDMRRYRGVGVTLLGSVPCSALFFLTYETVVPVVDDLFSSFCQLHTRTTYRSGPPLSSDAMSCAVRHCVVNASAAAIGEFVAATLRTPIEALKQRRQVISQSPAPRLLWRGWGATLMRDIPFSMIQYVFHRCRFVEPMASLVGTPCTTRPRSTVALNTRVPMALLSTTQAGQRCAVRSHPQQQQRSQRPSTWLRRGSCLPTEIVDLYLVLCEILFAQMA